MGLQWLVVMGLDRLHMLHMRWLLVMVMVVKLWLEMGVLVLRRMVLLLLLTLLFHSILLCALCLRFWCDSTDSCLGSGLGGFLGCECSFTLFDCASHVPVRPGSARAQRLDCDPHRWRVSDEGLDEVNALREPGLAAHRDVRRFIEPHRDDEATVKSVRERRRDRVLGVGLALVSLDHGPRP